MKTEIVSEGTCVCIREPRGEHCLEGYLKGERYSFERMKKIHKYFRVYPAKEKDYYETASPMVFKHHFEIDGEQGVSHG